MCSLREKTEFSSISLRIDMSFTKQMNLEDEFLDNNFIHKSKGQLPLKENATNNKSPRQEQFERWSKYLDKKLKHLPPVKDIKRKIKIRTFQEPFKNEKDKLFTDIPYVHLSVSDQYNSKKLSEDVVIISDPLTSHETCNRTKYLNEKLKKFHSIKKLEANVSDEVLEDHKFSTCIPYVNIKTSSHPTGTKVVTISNDQIEPEITVDTVLISDTESESKNDVSNKTRVKVYHRSENFCEVCDTSFRSRCSYLAHRLRHEKFAKPVVSLARLCLTADGKIKKKKLLPEKVVNILLEKYLHNSETFSASSGDCQGNDTINKNTLFEHDQSVETGQISRKIEEEESEEDERARSPVIGGISQLLWKRKYSSTVMSSSDEDNQKSKQQQKTSLDSSVIGVEGKQEENVDKKDDSVQINDEGNLSKKWTFKINLNKRKRRLSKINRKSNGETIEFKDDILMSTKRRKLEEEDNITSRGIQKRRKTIVEQNSDNGENVGDDNEKSKSEGGSSDDNEEIKDKNNADDEYLDVCEKITESNEQEKHESRYEEKKESASETKNTSDDSKKDKITESDAKEDSSKQTTEEDENTDEYSETTENCRKEKGINSKNRFDDSDVDENTNVCKAVDSNKHSIKPKTKNKEVHFKNTGKTTKESTDWVEDSSEELEEKTDENEKSKLLNKSPSEVQNISSEDENTEAEDEAKQLRKNTNGKHKSKYLTDNSKEDARKNTESDEDDAEESLHQEKSHFTKLSESTGDTEELTKNKENDARKYSTKPRKGAPKIQSVEDGVNKIVENLSNVSDVDENTDACKDDDSRKRPNKSKGDETEKLYHKTKAVKNQSDHSDEDENKNACEKGYSRKRRNKSESEERKKSHAKAVKNNSDDSDEDCRQIVKNKSQDDEKSRKESEERDKLKNTTSCESIGKGTKDGKANSSSTSKNPSNDSAEVSNLDENREDDADKVENAVACKENRSSTLSNKSKSENSKNPSNHSDEDEEDKSKSNKSKNPSGESDKDGNTDSCVEDDSRIHSEESENEQRKESNYSEIAESNVEFTDEPERSENSADVCEEDHSKCEDENDDNEPKSSQQCSKTNPDIKVADNTESSNEKEQDDIDKCATHSEYTSSDIFLLSTEDEGDGMDLSRNRRKKLQNKTIVLEESDSDSLELHNGLSSPRTGENTIDPFSHNKKNQKQNIPSLTSKESAKEIMSADDGSPSPTISSTSVIDTDEFNVTLACDLDDDDTKQHSKLKRKRSDSESDEFVLNPLKRRRKSVACSHIRSSNRGEIIDQAQSSISISDDERPSNNDRNQQDFDNFSERSSDSVDLLEAIRNVEQSVDQIIDLKKGEEMESDKGDVQGEETLNARIENTELEPAELPPSDKDKSQNSTTDSASANEKQTEGVENRGTCFDLSEDNIEEMQENDLIRCATSTTLESLNQDIHEDFTLRVIGENSGDGLPSDSVTKLPAVEDCTPIMTNEDLLHILEEESADELSSKKNIDKKHDQGSQVRLPK